jgi:hypothetical protein
VETRYGVFTGVSNRYSLPSIPGQSTYTLNVGLYSSVSGGDGYYYYIYATIYESTATNSQTYQTQDSQWIYYFDGTTAPPGSGVETLGSSLTAPGFNPPPVVTNLVIAGPTLIQQNSNVTYLATALFNDGTTSTNLTTTWSSSAFSISAGGILSAGTVQADTPVTISGTISYGNTYSNKLKATIVKVQNAKLLGLGLTNKQYRLQFTGTTGRRYAIEATTNLGPLANWIPIATNQIFSNSVFQFTDNSATNAKTRFYRGRQTP